MYNLVLREYLNMREFVYYSSPIKTDADRIKPRRKRCANLKDSRLKYVYNNPFTGEEIIEYLDDPRAEQKAVASEYQSFRRTRKAIFDLCMSNSWEYFITFTFNKEKVDRYSFDDCSKKMVFWLNNVKKLYASDLKYVIVPEQHKDGAWHFHGVISNCGNLSFVDSGYKDRSGRVIYNLFQYKFGFTTATFVSDNLSTCLYIQKYITKDVCKTLSGKKRYWCSRNLDRPKITKQYTHMSKREFEDSIQEEDYRMRIVYGEFYDLNYYTIYTRNAP